MIPRRPAGIIPEPRAVMDDFRERLSKIRIEGGGRGARPEPRRRKLAEATGDDSLAVDHIIRTKGVLVAERSYAGLFSGDGEARMLGEYRRAIKDALHRADIDDEVRALLQEPDGALFLDTETTGLGGSMVFMLGVMTIARGSIRVVQVFARDYSEEPALLELWRDMLRRAGMLVSFNGKSFDLPVLRDRLALHGLEAPEEPLHLDLLHHARRRWRGILPDCTLQTLEWKVCGRRRAGDIPGAEIPGVYHHYVRTKDPEDILTVFHHNALDLITMAELALALAAPA